MAGELLDAVAALEEEAALIITEARAEADEIVAQERAAARRSVEQTEQEIQEQREHVKIELEQNFTGVLQLEREAAQEQAAVVTKTARRHQPAAVEQLTQALLDPNGYR